MYFSIKIISVKEHKHTDGLTIRETDSEIDSGNYSCYFSAAYSGWWSNECVMHCSYIWI